MSSDAQTLPGPGTSVPGQESKPNGVIRTATPEMDGRFRIIDELGAGGMNRVYLGEDTKTGETVALRAFEHAKKVVETKQVREKRMSRMAREVKLVQAFGDHPNFLKFKGHMVDQDGDGFIVLEHVLGNELTHIISSAVQSYQGIRPKHSLVPITVVHEVGRQLLEAMQKLHSLKQIHRDIKPGNIMYQGEGDNITIKIIDFGLAKDLGEKSPEDSLTQEGDTMGSPEYMAPEQLMNAKGADHRADIYAVGAVLYEMVTGKKAVDVTGVCTKEELFGRLIGEFAKPFSLDRYPSRFVKHMNPDLEQLILDMLDRDPDKRPQTATDALERFEAVMALEDERYSSMPSVRPSAQKRSVPRESFTDSRISERPSESDSPPRKGGQKSYIALVLFVLAAVAGIGGYAIIKWQQLAANTPVSSSSISTTTQRSPYAAPPTSSASLVASAPASVASVTSPTPSVPPVSKEQLTDAERATIAAVRAQVGSGQYCNPMTKRQLISLTIQWKGFPDSYYWLAECAKREGNTSESYYREEYTKLSGGKTGPPP
ncbi:MAG: serine/threonine-protein kinase [Patescibacteria group bacterium]